MQELKIINEDNAEIIASHCYLADSFFTRFKGLLGRRQMSEGEGLLIKPCSSVHTLGMKMIIDVVFLSSDYQVLHIIEEMQPGKLSPVIKKSSSVLELPPGQVGRSGLKIGHRLRSISLDK
ncbi:hypothetical protein ASZ90_017937 [hydrocarbon metagenome]|uniref:DUF192 domain-containing protein n=1 Tax=hydrocarbon metagenome TaxID=938273 RepID=A0A0W8E892_9ZZZZ